MSCIRSSPRVCTSVLFICENCDNETNVQKTIFFIESRMMCTIEPGWLCNVLSNVLPGYHVDVRLHSTVPVLLTAPRHHRRRQRPGQGEEEERGRQDDTVPAATANYFETIGWEVNNTVLFTALWCYLAYVSMTTNNTPKPGRKRKGKKRKGKKSM